MSSEKEKKKKRVLQTQFRPSAAAVVHFLFLSLSWLTVRFSPPPQEEEEEEE